MNLLARTRNAKGRAAGYGGCLRCGATWDWKPSHSTPYGAGRGCFPLCEECWGKLTPAEREPYYESLWLEWQRQFALIRDPGLRAEALKSYSPTEHADILAAVRAGL